MKEAFEPHAKIFRALSNQVRLGVLESLVANRRESMGALAERHGVDENTIRYHLKVLAESGILRKQPTEGSAAYSLPRTGYQSFLVRFRSGRKSPSAAYSLARPGYQRVVEQLRQLAGALGVRELPHYVAAVLGNAGRLCILEALRAMPLKLSVARIRTGLSYRVLKDYATNLERHGLVEKSRLGHESLLAVSGREVLELVDLVGKTVGERVSTRRKKAGKNKWSGNDFQGKNNGAWLD